MFLCLFHILKAFFTLSHIYFYEFPHGFSLCFSHSKPTWAPQPPHSHPPRPGSKKRGCGPVRVGKIILGYVISICIVYVYNTYIYIYMYMYINILLTIFYFMGFSGDIMRKLGLNPLQIRNSPSKTKDIRGLDLVLAYANMISSVEMVTSNIQRLKFGVIVGYKKAIY